MSEKAGSRRTGTSRRGQRKPKPVVEEDAGPPKAKEAFAISRKPPPVSYLRPAPREDEAITNRVPPDSTQPAIIPDDLSRSMRLRRVAPLSEALGAAASSSGYGGAAKKAIRLAAHEEAKRRIAEERIPQPPEPGSKSFSEASLRKAFHVFDLDKNEVVGAKELKHIFNMLGEQPTDQEIDGMIQLCDIKGQGQVAFEDFLTIFSSPAESLRNVDVEALKEVVHFDRKAGSDDSSDLDEEEEEDNDSDLSN